MHAFAMVNTANMLLGIIKWSIGTNNQDAFSQLYKSLLRPMLEYAAPVWSPYLIKDIVALEKVKRRASMLQLIEMANTKEAQRISIAGSMF